MQAGDVLRHCQRVWSIRDCREGMRYTRRWCTAWFTAGRYALARGTGDAGAMDAVHYVTGVDLIGRLSMCGEGSMSGVGGMGGFHVTGGHSGGARGGGVRVCSSTARRMPPHLLTGRVWYGDCVGSEGCRGGRSAIIGVGWEGSGHVTVGGLGKKGGVGARARCTTTRVGRWDRNGWGDEWHSGGRRGWHANGTLRVAGGGEACPYGHRHAVPLGSILLGSILLHCPSMLPSHSRAHGLACTWPWHRHLSRHRCSN